MKLIVSFHCFQSLLSIHLRGLEKPLHIWQCICIYWHSCPMHANIGHACGNKERAAREMRANPPSNSSNALCAPVVGTGGAPRNRGPKLKNNRKRPFINQPASAKRIRITLETGIPSTFVPAELAARFSAHVRNTTAILTPATFPGRAEPR